MRLLLVEDDEFFAQRISEFLADNDIDVVSVKTTQDALGALGESYDGAILDVMLPNDPQASGISMEEARGGYLAGVALARKIRKLSPALPLVLLSADVVGGEARVWAKEQCVPLVYKYEDRGRLLSALDSVGIRLAVRRPRAFIVHGHDEEALAQLKDYLQNTLKWPEPTVLREMPNAGRTLIEKFEEIAGRVDWVFVLLTPDDTTFAPKSDDERRRTRQNVIFELGFFYGLFGRREGRVIVLQKGKVELPSDIQGIVWIDITDGIRSKGEDIRREVSA